MKTRGNKTEKDRRENPVRPRIIFGGSRDAIFISGVDGSILTFNRSAPRLTGYRPEELKALKLFNLYARVDVPRYRDYFERIQAGQSISGEVKIARKDGSEIYAEFSSRKIVIAGRTCAITLARDITARKQAEDQVHDLTHQLIKAQENERLKISRDLHDHIAQDLSTLKIGLETLFTDQPAAIKARVMQLSEILRRSIASVRDMAYDLRPHGLDQLGLVKTLVLLCEDYSQSGGGLTIDFAAAGVDELDLEYETEINLFRLIQEALNNIKRHADASRVTIRLVASSPDIVIRIKDNGKGFDLDDRGRQAFKGKRMGLQSMVERVHLLQGTMNVQSSPGKGNYILIEIPLKEKQRDFQEAHSDH